MCEDTGQNFGYDRQILFFLKRWIAARKSKCLTNNLAKKNKLHQTHHAYRSRMFKVHEEEEKPGIEWLSRRPCHCFSTTYNKSVIWMRFESEIYDCDFSDTRIFITIGDLGVRTEFRIIKQQSEPDLLSCLGLSEHHDSFMDFAHGSHPFTSRWNFPGNVLALSTVFPQFYRPGKGVSGSHETWQIFYFSFSRTRTIMNQSRFSKSILTIFLKEYPEKSIFFYQFLQGLWICSQIHKIFILKFWPNISLT